MKSSLARFAIIAQLACALAANTFGQNPPTLSLRFPDGDVAQEKFGSSQVVLEIVRTGDPAPVVSVDLKFTPGVGPPGSQAATPGVDFDAADQHIELASGETSRRVVVKILDGGEVEPEEFSRFNSAVFSREQAS